MISKTVFIFQRSEAESIEKRSMPGIVKSSFSHCNFKQSYKIALVQSPNNSMKINCAAKR